eukprot:tig00001107_g7105.t1
MYGRRPPSSSAHGRFRGDADQVAGPDWPELRHRVESLWAELHIPKREREHFAYNYLAASTPENMQKISHHINALLEHRARTIEVLKRIEVREDVGKRLKLAINSGADRMELADLLGQFEHCTAEVLTSILEWRSGLSRPQAFVFNGANYILKIRSDCQMTGEAGAALQRFPLLQTLSQVASAVAEGRDPEAVVAAVGSPVQGRRSSSDSNASSSRGRSPPGTAGRGEAAQAGLEALVRAVVLEERLQAQLKKEREALLASGFYAPTLRVHGYERPICPLAPSSRAAAAVKAAAAAGGVGRGRPDAPDALQGWSQPPDVLRAGSAPSRPLAAPAPRPAPLHGSPSGTSLSSTAGADPRSPSGTTSPPASRPGTSSRVQPDAVRGSPPSSNGAAQHRSNGRSSGGRLSDGHESSDAGPAGPQSGAWGEGSGGVPGGPALARVANALLAISTDLELGQCMRQVSRAARELVDGDEAMVYLIDDVRRELFSAGPDSRTAPRPAPAPTPAFPGVTSGLVENETRFAIHRDNGLAATCAVHARLMNLPDAQLDPRFNPKFDLGGRAPGEERGRRALPMLVAPLREPSGELLGVLEVARRSAARPFGAPEEALLELVAAQAGTALRNALRYEGALRGKRMADELVEVVKSLSQQLDMPSLLEKVRRNAASILNANACVIHLVDAERHELVTVHSSSEEPGDGRVLNEEGLVEERRPLGEGLAGWVALNGKTLNTSSRSSVAQLKKPGERAWLLTGHFRTLLALPLHDPAGQVIGVIEVRDKRLGEPGAIGARFAPGRGSRRASVVLAGSEEGEADSGFNAEDEEVLEAIGVQTGIMLRNARLYQETREAQARVQTLLEISKALSSNELDIGGLVTTIMTKARDLMDADRCSLFLIDHEKKQLFSTMADGSVELRFSMNQGIAGHVATTGEVVNIEDAYRDPRFNQEIDKKTGYTTRSILCGPLRNKDGDVVGVTQVINKRGRPFNKQDEELLLAFTSQAGVAIQNSQLFKMTVEMTNFKKSILTSITSLVLTLDLDGKVTMANHAPENILGAPWTEEGLRVTRYEEWSAAASADLYHDIKSVFELGGERVGKDCELKLRDARNVSVNYNIVPLLDGQNAKKGVVLIIEDISPAKRALNTLHRYLSPQLAEAVLQAGGAQLGGVRKKVTILFSDIRRFTSLTENMADPTSVVALLNDYLSEMVDCIFEEKGILDKYIGDAVMAVFGVPFTDKLDSVRACCCALKMTQRLASFNKKRTERGDPPLAIGIGINTGLVVSGNIGSEKRLEYTVIGDGVNLGSRLEGATKSFGVTVLISEFTYEEVSTEFITRELDAIRVVGKSHPIRVYELVGFKDEKLPAARAESIELFARGLERYRAMDWAAAEEAFERAWSVAQDPPSRVFLDRCRQLSKEPPPPDWDRVWSMTDK